MYNLHLSAEQIEIRDTVRAFVTRDIRSVALDAHRLDACDRRLLTQALERASQIGLRALALAEELGGAGADTLTCCIVTEELAAGDADIAAVLAQTSVLGGVLFPRMTTEQRARFLPHFLENDRYQLALAGHEPGADTALGVNYHRPTTIEAALRTSAVRRGDEWVIDGTKDCVANAPIAKLFAVEAAIEGRGSAMLLVPGETPGLTVRAHEQGRRWYHGACGELALADCRVPIDNLLPGARASLAGLGDRRRPQLAALNIGIGRAAYEAALDYAQLRVQGGRRIIEHQAIGVKLAEIAIKLDIARNAVWKAAWAADHPDAYADRSLADLPLARIAQVSTSQMIFEAAKDAAECFGAMGVMRDMPLQKYLHDARICLHSGDGNDDAKLRIAEALIGYRRPAAPKLAAE